MLLCKLAVSLLACCLLSVALVAQCSSDHRSSKTGGVLVKDFTITGTRTLNSTELAGITGELTGSCFNDDSEEMSERIRASLQNRGYFAVEIKRVDLKPMDPLGVPKPVLVEAEVSEGLRYRVGEISFLENHAFAAEKLREAFPLKTGDLFERGKIATGLESVHKLYGTAGYIDAIMIPATELASDGTAALRITVDEGPQYHMGKVEIIAGKELAARLLGQWKLAEGVVYDQSYIDRYIDANSNLLPANFTPASISGTQDCPNALIHLRLVIDFDMDTSKSSWKSIPCEPKDKSR